MQMIHIWGATRVGSTFNYRPSTGCLEYVTTITTMEQAVMMMMMIMMEVETEMIITIMVEKQVIATATATIHY